MPSAPSPATSLVAGIKMYTGNTRKFLNDGRVPHPDDWAIPPGERVTTQNMSGRFLMNTERKWRGEGATPARSKDPLAVEALLASLRAEMATRGLQPLPKWEPLPAMTVGQAVATLYAWRDEARRTATKAQGLIGRNYYDGEQEGMQRAIDLLELVGLFPEEL